MLETLAKVFFEFAKVTFVVAKVSRKLDINYKHFVKGCHPLPPGVRQEKGTTEFRFGSGSVPCVVGGAFGQSPCPS
jgi:hypothetical protein